jgi:hypothetical protein
MFVIGFIVLFVNLAAMMYNIKRGDRPWMAALSAFAAGFLSHELLFQILR